MPTVTERARRGRRRTPAELRRLQRQLAKARASLQTSDKGTR